VPLSNCAGTLQLQKSPANWICWKSPIYAENAEYAEYAEYVENAEYA